MIQIQNPGWHPHSGCQPTSPLFMITQVFTKCPKCYGETILSVDRDGLIAWREGHQHIQDALPELDDDQREMLITGLCPKCWKTVMEEKEEE